MPRASSYSIRLPAGIYKLTAHKDGFRDLTIDGIRRWKVGDICVHNLTLDVGTRLSRTVTVLRPRMVPIINPTAASVEGTITEQQTADLR